MPPPAKPAATNIQHPTFKIRLFNIRLFMVATLLKMKQAPQVTFEIQAQCPVTRARAGLLHTAHGDIETPVFMPVGTQATVKGLSQRDLADDLGVKILLANTYHLFLRPGHDLVRQMGGLHRFMSWPNCILTDSG